MPARKVADPLVVMALRVPASVARRWQVFGGDWRKTIRTWMVDNAPRSFADEMAELEAARARGAAADVELEEEF